MHADGSSDAASEAGKKQQTAWERALYETAAPLLARESMQEEYVDSIVQRLKETGPYMFVTQDLILAHARPENGVKHIDLAIGIAPEGIAFEGDKTARIVFLLVVEDQQKHMGILKDIRKALAKTSQVDELVKQTSARNVCDCLRQALQDK